MALWTALTFALVRDLDGQCVGFVFGLGDPLFEILAPVSQNEFRTFRLTAIEGSSFHEGWRVFWSLVTRRPECLDERKEEWAMRWVPEDFLMTFCAVDHVLLTTVNM